MNSSLPSEPLVTPVQWEVEPNCVGKVTHVVFDFDGTLSWLRHGWPELMLEVFEENMPPSLSTRDSETRGELTTLILALNGKPTIEQMRAFAEWSLSQGGAQLDPEQLRVTFQDRLDAQIRERTAQVYSKTVAPDAYVVAGARALLEFLAARSVQLFVLSSTVEHRVREEAELLGIAHFFGERIHGSPLDPSQFTKRAVFERILAEAGISGEQLLAFGDGPVEIAEAVRLGGAAVAVCSDENHNGSGVCDPWKFNQLRAAGAHAALPDFRNALELIAPLLLS
ncbi:MAG: HAD family hydrolase [Chthoniobacteraceae bacterium]|nr:HAD family hydrolase [Chthoniobacteraceae bacterium]